MQGKDSKSFFPRRSSRMTPEILCRRGRTISPGAIEEVRPITRTVGESMGSEALVASAIKSVIDLLRNLHDHQYEKKKDLFENVIQPLYESLTVIHKDYSQAFAKLLEHNAILTNDEKNRFIRAITEFQAVRSIDRDQLREELRLWKWKDDSRLPFDIKNFIDLCYEYFITRPEFTNGHSYSQFEISFYSEIHGSHFRTVFERSLTHFSESRDVLELHRALYAVKEDLMISLKTIDYHFKRVSTEFLNCKMNVFGAVPSDKGLQDVKRWTGWRD
jgi:hypothetical protein